MTSGSMVKAGAAIGLVLALALAIGAAIWWTATAPTSGEVVAAWLEPAHDEQVYVGSTCYSYGKDGLCTFSMPRYDTRHVPDRCWVHFNDTEVTKRDRTVAVPCDTLATYEVGQWVAFQ